MPSDAEDEEIVAKTPEVEAASADKKAAEDVAVLVGAENVAAADTEANDVASVEKAHYSHLSKKRRRRKKEKLDGPHAMYAKKLKVRKN